MLSPQCDLQHFFFNSEKSENYVVRLCTDKKSLHRLLLCESSKIRILFLDDTKIKSLHPSSLYVLFPVPASFYKDAADSELTSITSIWE